MRAVDRAPGGGETDRFLVALIAAALGLALLAIGLVFTVGHATPPPPDPNSPVGVVQSYVEALRRGEFERADAYLTRSAREAAQREPYRDRYLPPASPSSETRLLYQLASESDDSAEVRVTVNRFSARASPFSVGSDSTAYTVNLVREDGAWRITRPLAPFAFQ
jgi:hypothetical protein